MGNWYLAGRPSRGCAPANCYFMLAWNFRASDGAVAIIYGVFLAKSDRIAEAQWRHKLAISTLTEPADGHSDLGLLYLKNGKNAQDPEHAKIAYDRVCPLLRLKRELKELGFDVD